MGGCVASLMDKKHQSSVIPHPGIQSSKHFFSAPYNTEVSRPTQNSTGVYRSQPWINADYKTLYNEYYNGNLVTQMQKNCQERAGHSAVAYRPIEKIETVTTKDSNGRAKKWEYICYKPTVSYTYTEFWSMIVNIGQAFKKLGVKPGDRVGIYEDTRLEWLVTCYGLWTIGATGVTVYANLGQDALAYAIKEADIKFILCNGGLAQNIVMVCHDSHIHVPTIVYLDKDKLKDEIKTPIYDWYKILEEQRAANNGKSNIPLHPIKPDDLALIMYTSGTTGDPKGVMMTHGNLFAVVRLVRERVEFYLPTRPEGATYLAYLPLAHVLEFAAENVFIQSGWYVTYGNPRTLTSAAAKPHGDLEEFKPHFFIGVPRVFDTIKKTIEGRIPAGLKKRIFQQAYEARWQCLKEGKDTPYYNQKVFGTVRAVLGGRCVAILSGGAPLSAKTQQFITVVSGACVVQGYGLTETCAAICTQLPWDLNHDEIGALMNCVELKLRDTGDWVHTSDPPQGEILVRGPAVTKGYYKQGDKTKESWDKDGWFATGDVGQFTKGAQSLKIVGRVKALAKTAHGEYIALDSLEATYVLNELCMPNGVCIVVDSQKSFICALVLTDEDKATKFAVAHNIEGKWPDFLNKPEFHEAAAESLAATAKKHGRKPFECVRRVRVLNDEWTPENGILTAAQKLKRREVDKRYAKQIKELFVEDDSGSMVTYK